MENFITNLPSVTKQSNNELIDFFFDDIDTFFVKMFPDFTRTDIDRSIEGYPVSSIYTNKDGDLKFEIAVTGFNEEEVSASVKDGFLIIKAEKKDKEEEADWRKISGKLKRSSFEKRFRLSNKLDLEAISASIKNGVLIVTIKAKEESKPKLIDITTND